MSTTVTHPPVLRNALSLHPCLGSTLQHRDWLTRVRKEEIPLLGLQTSLSNVAPLRLPLTSSADRH